DRRRPGLGAHPRLAVLPAPAIDLPRHHTGHGAAPRRRSDHLAADLSDPGGRPPRPPPARPPAGERPPPAPPCQTAGAPRLGRTLRAWRPQLLASFSTNGVSNGGTEAINLIIEKTRRLAHGLRNYSHSRLPHL